MKTTLALIFFASVVNLLCGCATATPFGSTLAGVDAEEIEISGNYKTGAYSIKAKGLNMSTGLNVAGKTLTETTKLKILGRVGETLIGEGGDLASQALN